MLDHLIKECKVTGETVKKHLDEFFLANPNQLEKVKYYIPKSELIVSLTIQRLKENITEVNLNPANNIPSCGEKRLMRSDYTHNQQRL